MAKRDISRSVRSRLTDSLRYVKGGQPLPEAVESLLAYVSDRPLLEFNAWTEQARLKAIDSEAASFVYDYFDARGIPMGQIRPDDRLEADLHLTRVLPQEWGDEFQEAFLDHFCVTKLFSRGPGPETILELLGFVQQELENWRAETEPSDGPNG
jgi:hypothetical protein